MTRQEDSKAPVGREPTEARNNTNYVSNTNDTGSPRLIQAAKPDRTEIIRALQLILLPGQVTELRALEAQKRGHSRIATWSGFFDHDHIEAMADAALSLQQAKGIYFTPNPCNRDLLARAANKIKSAQKNAGTKDHEILKRHWLLIDCDPQRLQGISSTDREHDAAIQKARGIAQTLQELGWPMPIIADSGNGAHLLYRIEVPADDAGLIQRCLGALAQRFDDSAVTIDRSVFNPARIWKLYGTVAAKGDSTPDRPHRLSKILQAPDRLEVVPTQLLKSLGAEARAEAPTKTSIRHPHGGRGIDVAKWIADHGLNVQGPEPYRGNLGPGKCWVFPVCPWNPDHTDNAAYVIQFDDGKISAGCHHNGCADKDWHALRDAVEPGWRNERGTHETSAVERFRPFPVDALPEPVRRFVTVGAKAMGCDPSYIALPILSALAAAIGNTRRIQLKRSWTEPAIVWTGIVGESGTMKSPALELALGPVRKRQGKAMRECAKLMEAYREELLTHERELLSWKRKNRSTRPPEKPQEPVADRYWCDDTTIEALAVLLVNQPRGLLMVRDELAGWLGGFDRYAQNKGGDVAKWLEVFGGRPLLVDRKTGPNKTLHVPRAAVSITGGIQPATLRRALGRQHLDNGLAARLLLAWPPRRKKRWPEADIPPEVETAVEEIFETLYKLVPRTDADGEPCPGIIELTPEGRRAWVKFYNAHAEEQLELTGDLSAAWSKLEGYAARLALVIHFIRWAAGAPTLASPDAVDEISINAGAQLSQWFGHEARRVYTMLDELAEDRDRRELVELIERRGGTITVRELQQSVRRISTSQQAEQELEELVSAGYGRWEEDSPKPKRGRPSKIFRLSAASPGHGAGEGGGGEGGSFVDVDSVDSVDTLDSRGPVDVGSADGVDTPDNADSTDGDERVEWTG